MWDRCENLNTSNFDSKQTNHNQNNNHVNQNINNDKSKRKMVSSILYDSAGSDIRESMDEMCSDPKNEGMMRRIGNEKNTRQIFPGKI